MNTFSGYKHPITALFIISLLLFSICNSFAQPELPKRALAVRATQSIHFGAFCVTGPGGGTVTVGYDGSRSSIGDIVLLSVFPMAQPAIFEIRLCHSQNISINYETPNVNLTGVGGSLSLNIGPTDKGGNGARFTASTDCNSFTQLRVGGTLTITGAALPGNYSGYFAINFIQE